mgnify:CR=1 FL=1
MADLKIQGVSPSAGKIKLGSSDVAKIYKGPTLVWPISGGCPGTGFTFLYKSNLARLLTFLVL